MKFFKILDNLKEQHDNDKLIRANGTILLHPDRVPRARHMLYKPLDDKLINDYLVSQYIYAFPKEYIEFLKYTNGADLCTTRIWHNIKNKRIPVAGGLFTIYGLPRTQPFGRPDNMEEPFDMRIEDLRRHDDIPKNWLACGTYIRDYNFKNNYDIFIDTETGNVYSVVRNTTTIVDSWNSLDDCFCNIYHSFDDMNDEYECPSN